MYTRTDSREITILHWLRSFIHGRNVRCGALNHASRLVFSTRVFPWLFINSFTRFKTHCDAIKQENIVSLKRHENILRIPKITLKIKKKNPESSVSCNIKLSLTFPSHFSSFERVSSFVRTLMIFLIYVNCVSVAECGTFSFRIFQAIRGTSMNLIISIPLDVERNNPGAL